MEVQRAAMRSLFVFGLFFSITIRSNTNTLFGLLPIEENGIFSTAPVMTWLTFIWLVWLLGLELQSAQLINRKIFNVFVISLCPGREWLGWWGHVQTGCKVSSCFQKLGKVNKTTRPRQSHSAPWLQNEAGSLYCYWFIHCVSKNIPNIFDSNVKTNYQILIIFGMNIFDTTCHQMTI